MPPGIATTVTVLLALDEPLEHDGEELRSRAEDLLSRPPYTDAEPTLLGRAFAWVGDAVAQVVQRLVDGIAATGPAGAWTIAIIGALVLALVIWRLTRGATLDRRSPEVPAALPARSAASWRAEAAEHDTAGRHRDAVRCWYAAVVVGLVERGTIDDVPGRTVRELDVEVARSAPDLHQAVVDAGARFEAVLYGGEQATSEGAATVRATANQVARTVSA